MAITKAQLAQVIDDLSTAYQRGSFAIDGTADGITLTAGQITTLQGEYVTLHDSSITFFAALTPGSFDLVP